MAPPLRLQPDELIMWTFGGTQKSDQEQDQILQLENRVGLGGDRKSEIDFTLLYPNQRGFVNIKGGFRRY